MGSPARNYFPSGANILRSQMLLVPQTLCFSHTQVRRYYRILFYTLPAARTIWALNKPETKPPRGALVSSRTLLSLVSVSASALLPGQSHRRTPSLQPGAACTFRHVESWAHTHRHASPLGGSGLGDDRLWKSFPDFLHYPCTVALQSENTTNKCIWKPS